MDQDKSNLSTGIIDTGESKKSQQLIAKIIRYDNLDQNIIQITEDKLELILMKNFKKMEDKKSWVTPFGIFTALLLVFLTTENFKNFLSVPASVWQARCYITMIIFGSWTLFSAFKAWNGRKTSIGSIINQLKLKEN